MLIDTIDAASYAEVPLPGAVNIHEIVTYLTTTTPRSLVALRETSTEAFAKAGLSESPNSLAASPAARCKCFLRAVHMRREMMKKKNSHSRSVSHRTCYRSGASAASETCEQE